MKRDRIYRRGVLFAVLLLLWALPVAPLYAQEPVETPADEAVVTPTATSAVGAGSLVAITSPASGARVGGIVSVLGTAAAADFRHYSLAFGLGDSPNQWLPIVSSDASQVVEGRLALWDTRTIPDGAYTLRLRVLRGGQRPEYVDHYVRGVAVTNAPQTPTPSPTPYPTATATLTPTPSITPTEQPTPDPEDGTSPYLYVTQMDQFDPLCPDRPQRYSVWVSNVGVVTVTNVILSDLLPTGTEMVAAQSTEGATLEADGAIARWQLGDLAPGEARQVEVTLAVPTWLQPGDWLANRVEVTSDQVELIASTEESLVSDCEGLQEAAPTRAVVLPPPQRTPTGSSPSPAGKPTLVPSPTTILIDVPEGQVQAGMDILTLVMAAGLGILAVVTGILVYRRAVK